MSESSAKVVASLEDRDASGHGIRIEFLRLRDRYAHRILVVGCEELPVLLLESIEGKPGEAWPPSPALQALNIDDLAVDPQDAPVPVAMLVGMSGKSHWSLSIETEGRNPRHSGKSGRWHGTALFKGACRIKEHCSAIRTEYSIGQRVAVNVSDDQLSLNYGSGTASLYSSPTVEGTTQSTWRYDAKRHRAIFSMAPPESATNMAITLQWQYRVARGEL